MVLPSWNRYPGRYAIVFAAVALLLFLLEHVNGRFWLNDFRVYYDSARSLLDGQPLYGVARGLDSGIFKYAPVLALLYVPLALLPYAIAASVQYLLIVAAFIGASLLADRLIRTHLLPGKPGTYAPLFLLGLVVVVHLHRELHLGNVNVMLLWLLLFALDRLLAGKPVLGGAFIGLAMLTKPHFVVLLPLLLLRKEFKATGVALTTVLVGLLLPALFLGATGSFALHGEWLGEMAKHNASLIYTGGDNYNAVDTVYSFLHRAVLKHFVAAPSGLETAIVLGIIAAAFGALVLWNLRKGDAKSFVFEYLLLIALVPSITLTDTEHFLLALPLVAFVLHHLLPRAEPRWLAVVAVPILFGFGGNWEDALGPASDWMIHHGVLGMANAFLLLLCVFLFLRDRRSNFSAGPVSSRA